MANSTVQPYTGPLTIDLQHLEGVVVDMADGATRGLRREKEGVEGTIKELGISVPAHGAAIGVATEVLGRIMTATERLAELRAAKLTLAKMLEVVEETEVCLEDEREGDIGLVVGSVRRVGGRDPGVLVHFEQTIRYHGQIALRAAKTRRKALAQAAAEEAAPGATEGATPEPQDG
jgi:hypothetical protein